MDVSVVISLGVLASLPIAYFLRSAKKPFIVSLTGKHVFVTGASSGIGLAIANKCLLEGAYVTIVSRSSKNLEHAAKSLVEQTCCGRDKLKCQVADVGDYSSISAAVKGALAWRPIDVLVCNAGLTRGGYLEKSSLDDIDTVIRTNLNGAIYPLYEALPTLKEHSASNPVSIVIISSMASFYMLYGHAIYTATKYGLRGLAECLRMELVPYKNIRLTLMCPGFVNTPFLEDLVNQGEITEILGKVNLFSKKSAETPEHTAECTVASVKRGSYLVMTQPIGSQLLALGRGTMPADNVGTYIFELLMLVPLRIIYTMISFNVKRLIDETVGKYKKA